MGRKVIGQEVFEFSGTVARNDLERLDEVVDWSALEDVLSGISSGVKGQAGWPPLALFKALLLSMWYDLSDVKLAEALDDRASFRKFCGFSRSEPVPERTAFVRFRKALFERGLSDDLFACVTAQLKARHIKVKTGALIDATIIDSASKSDDEARYVKHKGRKARHGCKAHVTADIGAALIETLRTTTANINDGKAGKEIIPDEPGDVFADSAYRGAPFKKAVADRGGKARVVQTGVWARNQDEADAVLAKINGPIHAVRGRIEKIFGTMKRSYGLARMRWRGLAKAGLQISLAAIAYNMKRSLNLA